MKRGWGLGLQGSLKSTSCPQHAPCLHESPSPTVMLTGAVALAATLCNSLSDWWPLRLLAQTCAHAAVRSALRAAYVRLRGSGIIAVAAQRSLASSLLELPLDTVICVAGEPAVHEVLQDQRWDAPAASRLPARSAERCRCRAVGAVRGFFIDIRGTKNGR